MLNAGEAAASGWTPQQVVTSLVAVAGLALGIFNFWRARGEPGRKRQAEWRKELREALQLARRGIVGLETVVLRDGEFMGLPSEVWRVSNWAIHPATAPPVEGVGLMDVVMTIHARIGLFEVAGRSLERAHTSYNALPPDALAQRAVEARDLIHRYEGHVQEHSKVLLRLLDDLTSQIDQLDKKG